MSGVGSAFAATRDRLADRGIEDTFCRNVLATRLVVVRIGEPDNLGWWDDHVFSEIGQTRIRATTTGPETRAQIEHAIAVGQRAERDQIPADAVSLFSLGPRLESRLDRAIDRVDADDTNVFEALETLSVTSLDTGWTTPLVETVDDSVDVPTHDQETEESDGSVRLGDEPYTEDRLEQQWQTVLATLLSAYGTVTDDLRVPYYPADVSSETDTSPLASLGGVWTDLKTLDRGSVTLGVLVVVAAVVRLYGLGQESLWLDEAVSLNFVTRQYSTIGLVFELPQQDPHPPLYYLLLDVWVAVFGTGEASVRLLSALLGIMAVAFVYAIGTKLFDREAGAVAGLLLALSPFNIYYSQEARMYALMTLLTAVSVYYLVDYLEHGERRRQAATRYVVATVLLGYTHVFAVFVIFAENLYVLARLMAAENWWPVGGQRAVVERARRIPDSIRGWVRVQVAVGALLSPWLLGLLGRVLSISGGNGSRISWIDEPTLVDLPETVVRYVTFYGRAVADDQLSFPVVGVDLFVVAWIALALAVVALVASTDEDRLQFGPRSGVMLALALFLTPLVGSYLVSVLVTPIFVPRYTISASIGLFLLVGVGVSTLRSIDPLSGRLGVRHVFVALIVVGMATTLPAYYAQDQKQQWEEAVTTVESAADSDSVVVVSESYMQVTYRYYADRPNLTVEYVPDDIPLAELQPLLDGHDEVWLVLSHTDGTLIDRVRSPSQYRTVETQRYNGIDVHRLGRANETG